MSGDFSRRYQDWLQQAERDLEAANALLAAKLYEHAVYFAHQSAEKVAKSLFIALSFTPPISGKTGHSLSSLFEPWKPHIEGNAELQQAQLELDTQVGEPRYPTEKMHPWAHYTEVRARNAIDAAKKLLAFGRVKVPEVVAKLTPSPTAAGAPAVKPKPAPPPKKKP